MPSKIPCFICGALILPETAKRTDGKCMPCFNDKDGIRAAALLAERTPPGELLERLDRVFRETALRVARHAASGFEGEGIYGCWIFHTQLLSGGVCLFTEAGLDQVAESYRERGRSFPRTDLRWNPCASPHQLCFSEELAEADELFLALDRHRRPQAINAEIERIFLRALQDLRREEVFSTGVVLTLPEGDQSDAERYAYAEPFCNATALQKFRAELLAFEDDSLQLYRRRISFLLEPAVPRRTCSPIQKPTT